ncbi:SUF system FeS assembly protein, NifU family [Bifidobacterium actinocoloniiforme DSM 22766]|uniref:SUF system FeS assembly protein, NifU family n=1 Tax=Bifidobacterium actinocoloniiforme DSM 22766 TaxID=1437605 RepID=A0A086Z088_9BIFI|nr:SUF system NifU family Fe-S cluster assembly protein [Bifidobacterium actinocoloniiforme]AKV55194.1 nitrogen fixation protein NifU [Bifidobacterium actinocoloniiforme DSM 22766]KFI39938.1 SUF system FeS assembly protein, NifU family [Bifidobacterium actinocoloniiforme DSM 22766]
MADDYGMSEQELEQMYQEVILDAAKHPHGRIDSADRDDPAAYDGSGDGAVTLKLEHEYCVPAQSQQFNPTCGDTATVHVEVSDGSDGGPNRIERVVWEGQGCSISQASLSIMVDLVQGRSVDEAMGLARAFHQLMESRGAGLDDEAAQEELGDAIAFQGVSRYPMRIKCALLAWEGLKASVATALTRIDEGAGDSAGDKERS